MRINIGLAQIYPKLGDLGHNLAVHLDYLQQAREQGVDLLIFPELSLTGYQVQDLVPEVALRVDADDPVFSQLLDASRDIDIVIGFVHEDSRNRFYIADAYLAGGQILHIHHKLYLPTYAMFDESRYFAQGNSVRAFDTRFGRLGMLICEDFWHVSPPYLLWLDGADILILNSSSPSRGLNESDRLTGTRWVELVNQAYGGMFTSYILHCNRVGYEDGKNFWGALLSRRSRWRVHDPRTLLRRSADHARNRLESTAPDPRPPAPPPRRTPRPRPPRTGPNLEREFGVISRVRVQNARVLLPNDQ